MKSPASAGMRVDWDVPIPMDDGIVLRADVFSPAAAGRYPVLLSNGNLIASAGDNNVDISQKPLEVLDWSNESGSQRTVQLVVNRLLEVCGAGA